MKQSLLNMPMTRMQRFGGASIYFSIAVSGFYLLLSHYLKTQEKQSEHEEQRQKQLQVLPIQYDIEQWEKQYQIKCEIKRQQKPWKYCHHSTIMREEIEKWKVNPKTLWPQDKMDKYSRTIIRELRKEPGGVLQALDNYGEWFSPYILERERAVERLRIQYPIRSPEERERQRQERQQEKDARKARQAPTKEMLRAIKERQLEREQQREIKDKESNELIEHLGNFNIGSYPDIAKEIYNEIKESQREIEQFTIEYRQWYEKLSRQEPEREMHTSDNVIKQLSIEVGTIKSQSRCVLI